MTRHILACVFVCLCAQAPAAEPAAFARKPTARKAGDKVRISFALSAPTDVEVAVLDGKGDVVRHLAAGLVGGPRAPAPLAPALEQEIDWDGKDDLGRPAPDGSRVRVGLGTQARLGKVLFYEPGISFSPRAVNVGPDGLLYVLMEHGQTKSTFLLQAYTRDGKYVKTIMPYPADLAPERLAGLERVRLPDGRWLPGIHMAAFRDLYPVSTGVRPQTMPITSKGWILLVNASKTHNAGTRPHHLLVVDTGGGTPLANYVGPPGCAEQMAHGFCWTALSPDEKWIYTSGHRKGTGNDDNFSTPPHNVVYRIAWDDKGLAKPFIGELYKEGNDETHLNTPQGLATDTDGRIYVADSANNRVAVFNPDGKWHGKIDVEAPDQIAVDRKAGAVYVLTMKRIDRKAESKVVKFTGIGKPPMYSVDVGMPYCVMNVDTSGDQPVLWLARTLWESPDKKRGIEKLVDLGDRFAPPVEVIRHRALPDVCQTAASMVNDDVFVHSYSEHQFARLDGRTGEVKLLPKIGGQDVAVGPLGQMLTVRMTKWSPGLKDVDQFDRDGNPMKLAGAETHVIKDVPGNVSGHAATASKGLCASPRGEIIVIDDSDGSRGLSVYGPDGKQVARKIVDGLIGSDGSPVIDVAGNVYVASAARPAGEAFPKVLQAGKPPGTFYPWMYGSVIKFGPKGGRLYYKPREMKQPDGTPVKWPPDGAEKMLKLTSFLHSEVYIDGAAWCRPGFTVAPGGYSCCACYTSRFCVDCYGRVFIPDVGLFSVLVVDAANNELLRFGDYGNEDSAGPGSRQPKPEIPLSWPYAVSVGRSGIYVSDFINRRIVRVDLVAAAQETVDIK